MNLTASPVWRVLGIETTCDETAAAVVSARAAAGSLLPNSSLSRSCPVAVLGPAHIEDQQLHSQIAEHRPYGGVMPEIAARAHLERLPHLIRAVMGQTGYRLDQLDAIAVCRGPGLVGGLLVGLTAAKSLALAAQRPLLAINHLEAHALSPRLTHPVSTPYLLLLLSGGHSQLVAVQSVGQYRVLSSTRDDAAGEVFDKIGRLMGLPYPAGPIMERLAATAGDPRQRPALPRPMRGNPCGDFSFSGLKTAAANVARNLVTHQDRAQLAAAVQDSIGDVITDRLDTVWPRFITEAAPYQTEKTALSLVAAGGVIANQTLRQRLQKWSHQRGVTLTLPPVQYCTDNAVTVAWAGLERLAAGFPASGLSIGAAPRLSLESCGNVAT